MYQKWRSEQVLGHSISLCFIPHEIKNTASHLHKESERKQGRTDKLSQKTNFIHSEVHEIPNSNLNLLLEGTLSAFLTSNYHKTGDCHIHSYDHSSQAPIPSNLQLREKMPHLNNHANGEL